MPSMGRNLESNHVFHVSRNGSMSSSIKHKSIQLYIATAILILVSKLLLDVKMFCYHKQLKVRIVTNVQLTQLL